MNVLVVATHPDDEVLGCGGVMARHAAEGDDVQVLVVSRALAEVIPSEQTERTWEEMPRAHAVLGVSRVHALDFPAPRLDTTPEHEIADAIRRVLSEVRPSLL